MEVNAGNLARLFTGYNAAFKEGLGMVEPMHELVATTVPSSTESNEYDWLGQVPGMREWLGDRHIHALKSYGYTVKNKDFELTIGVPRNKIKDDTYGVYSPLFKEMGRSTQAHPSQLVFALLNAGFSEKCYDGQYFFDTDHPVIAADGSVSSVANTDGGSGTPWFLIDDTRALKPIIFQEREKPNFVPMDDPTATNVFMRKEYIYGVDGRYNVGFGFWQFAWGSKQTLNAANYAIARAGLSSMKGDHGRPLGVMPKLLVVPPSLESAALKIVNNELGANGETNEWKGTATVKVVPWLA